MQAVTFLVQTILRLEKRVRLQLLPQRDGQNLDGSLVIAQ
jgi:hypothetical protein